MSCLLMQLFQMAGRRRAEVRTDGPSLAGINDDSTRGIESAVR